MSGPSRRLAVGFEYDGTRYAGWQSQTGLPTIQDSLQQALSAVADHRAWLSSVSWTMTEASA